MKITVRISSESAGRIAVAAKKIGVPVSTYVRMLAEGGRDTSRAEAIAIEQLRRTVSLGYSLQGLEDASEIRQLVDDYIARFLATLE